MKKKNGSIFFEIFAGEYVEILTDLSISHTAQATEEGYISGPPMPMTVAGFVMDTDEYFIYLSPDGEQVNQALPVSAIKHIQIVEIKNELEQLLDEVPEPNNDAGYN